MGIFGELADNGLYGRIRVVGADGRNRQMAYCMAGSDKWEERLGFRK